MIALISSSNRENLKKKNINIRKEKKKEEKELSITIFFYRQVTNVSLH